MISHEKQTTHETGNLLMKTHAKRTISKQYRKLENHDFESKKQFPKLHNIDLQFLTNPANAKII
jgi:hypothetical protein